MPPASLRVIPVRGTPPVAGQSQFHSGSVLGRALATVVLHLC